MVLNCCVFGCKNRKSRGSTLSFHTFPMKDLARKQQWIKNISREDVNGKPWQPSLYDRVCSTHFKPADFKDGTLVKCLKDDAVPTIFPNYPSYKQPTPSRKRPPPKERPFPSPSTSCASSPRLPKYSCMDHTYSYQSVEEHLRITKEKLAETVQKLQSEREKTRILGQKVHRQKCKITSILTPHQ
ncbi:THAP domain-containing protein 1 [Aplysia californica]|uniref:THAP domain-containing protein 1 n=1 Tax=Aplysia californica TaxID=6500 RepID=A0ABM0JIL7_APLCA|nr:THAP domain-containing protein 1 [Aplysia californica]